MTHTIQKIETYKKPIAGTEFEIDVADTAKLAKAVNLLIDALVAEQKERARIQKHFDGYDNALYELEKRVAKLEPTPPESATCECKEPFFDAVAYQCSKCGKYPNPLKDTERLVCSICGMNHCTHCKCPKCEPKDTGLRELRRKIKRLMLKWSDNNTPLDEILDQILSLLKP